VPPLPADAATTMPVTRASETNEKFKRNIPPRIGSLGQVAKLEHPVYSIQLRIWK
jgi:hypothetical protein